MPNSVSPVATENATTESPNRYDAAVPRMSS